MRLRGAGSNGCLVLETESGSRMMANTECLRGNAMKRSAVAMLALLVAAASGRAGEKELTPAERGYKALTETAFIPAFWTQNAIPTAWKQWENVNSKPADYEAAVRERYGLHEAPYPNNGLPM